MNFIPKNISGLKRLAVIVIILISGFLVFLICFSFLSSQLPAADSISHFRLHLSAILLICGALLIILQVRWIAFYVIGGAIIGIVNLGPAFPVWNNNLKGYDDTKIIKIIQLNLYFRNQTPEKIINFIHREKPDIITLQEVSRKNQIILSALKNTYPYQIVCKFAGVGAVGILSRHARVSNSSSHCIKKKGLAWLRVKIYDQEISVASLHLHWPYPYGQLQHIKHLKQHLKQIIPPVIIGGDFNAAPWSHAVSHIANITRTKVVRGIRFTLYKQLRFLDFKLKIGLPIDHILISPSLSVKNIYKGQAIGSDHLPIIAQFAIQP